MAYDVEVKELPEQRIASIRRVVRTSEMEAAFAEMLPAVWRRRGGSREPQDGDRVPVLRSVV
jgi:hypothetical protein